MKEMPRPCAVEFHVCHYYQAKEMGRCHGLAPWSFTFATTTKRKKWEDATTLRRGVSRSPLLRRERNRKMPRPCAVEFHVCHYYHAKKRRRCHGLVPWSITFATTTRQETKEMPRPCAVESHACRYYFAKEMPLSR